jgi:hypothetical protein
MGCRYIGANIYIYIYMGGYVYMYLCMYGATHPGVAHLRHISSGVMTRHRAANALNQMIPGTVPHVTSGGETIARTSTVPLRTSPGLSSFR